MTPQRDARGQLFIEVPTIGEERLRVTYVPPARGGVYPFESSLRIQIRDASGHLRQGPEFPLKCLGDIVSGMISLMLATRAE